MMWYNRNDLVRSWNRGCIHSVHWSNRITVNGHHIVFNIGSRSGFYRYYASSHWSSGI
jgi:hypothetical protein